MVLSYLDFFVNFEIFGPWITQGKPNHLDEWYSATPIGVAVYHLTRWLGFPCAIHGPKISKLTKIKLRKYSFPIGDLCVDKI